MTKDEALRMAIEVFDIYVYGNKTNSAFADKAYRACKDALAQPTAEQSSLVQEPVAYLKDINNPPFQTIDFALIEEEGAYPVYTTPPSREWVGLSDVEISELWYKSQNDIEGVNLGFTTQEHFFAGMIEAKLREKNNGA